VGFAGFFIVHCGGRGDLGTGEAGDEGLCEGEVGEAGDGE